jgi:hypothetical protein
MRRWLGVFFALVSLALCVACVRLTLRSYRVKDKWEYVSANDWSWYTISKQGRVDLLYTAHAPHDDYGWTYIRGAPGTTGGTDYGARFLGFGTGVAPAGGRFVNVPYWFLILLTALWPLFVARAELRRWRRFGEGLCPVCCYDLRASADRCPECGTSTDSPRLESV